MTSAPFWLGSSAFLAYEELFSFCGNQFSGKSPVVICFDGDFCSFFKELIYCIFNKIDVVVVDGPMSLQRLRSCGLIGEVYSFELRKQKETVSSTSLELQGDENWKLTTFTSGTTGIPKMVTHNRSSIFRNIRENDLCSKHVWAFAYNPAHYAGIQVLLQAFVNRNPMVQFFDMSVKDVDKNLSENNVTHISATPSFIRQFLLPLTGCYDIVESISSGGEAFDTSITDRLREIFPKAKIKSIYASTEAGTLFSGENGIFKISERLRGLVKIGNNNELLIHNSLLNNINGGFDALEWYNTGDLVEFVSNDHFKIVGRSSDVVNIGGYKVNPLEIEAEILNVSGVIDVMVCGRKNSVMGNILACCVKINNTLTENNAEDIIVGFLKNRLDEWQIPRVFRVVEEITYTQSGKKVREWKKR